MINPKLLPVAFLLLLSLKVASRISYRIVFSGIEVSLISLCTVSVFLLEDRSDICFLPALKNLPWSP